MSLTKLDTAADTVDHICNACGADHTIPLSTIYVGSGRNPYQINLPECSCGALEVIVRPSKNEPEGSPVTGARQLAHLLGEKLVALGRTRPVAPPEDAPSYEARLAEGDLVGPARTHDFSVAPVSDCCSLADTAEIEKANAEGQVARRIFKSRVEQRTGAGKGRRREQATLE
jgi:hypothetical protein